MLEIKQHELTVKDIETMPEESIFIPESDYGLAEIYYRNEQYELYAIPMYGGDLVLEIVSSEPQTILRELQGWC